MKTLKLRYSKNDIKTEDKLIPYLEIKIMEKVNKSEDIRLGLFWPFIFPYFDHFKHIDI